MDLWIRTQNKDKLLKVSEIKARKCDTTIDIVGDNVLLAQYSTKEKAMAVLDEIQKKIGCIIINKPAECFSPSDLAKMKKCQAFVEPSQLIFDTGCVVYTMPEDVEKGEEI